MPRSRGTGDPDGRTCPGFWPYVERELLVIRRKEKGASEGKRGAPPLGKGVKGTYLRGLVDPSVDPRFAGSKPCVPGYSRDEKDDFYIGYYDPRGSF